MPKNGDIIADKYKIEQLIGVGGMGAVFSALHQFTGKRVAVKWMLPELAKDADAVQRFMREAHAAGRINHPNVVNVYDVGQHADTYFLVMEFLQGEPLTSALARRDLTASEVLALLVPAMRGVAAAHRQGVVHRDLKPDNIFLAYEEDGVRRDAKVLDFGISKISNDNQTNLRLTRTGAVVGTPYYMSPEQIRGSATLDKRADIYSIGVILYESLSGQVPFQAETYGELVIEVATGTAKPLDVLVPNLPAELSRIVLRSMARDMNQRYPSMESLISALEPFISSNAPRSSRPSVTSGEQQRASIPLDPRDSSPSVNTKPSTKPHLAATPFAAEHEADPFKRRGTMVGMSAFAVAAVVLVGGIWFFTREREPTETLVMPAQAEQPLVPTAAAQPPAPALAEPGMASPMPSGTATALANDPPSAPGSDVNTAPAAPDSVPVHGVSAPSSRMRGNSDSSSKRQRGSRKRGDAHDGASAIDSAPLRVDSVSPPPAARRARSGKLNVDEF